MTWCHRYHITLKARHILGYLNVMADLLSRSNRMVTASAGVQTDLSKVVHSSCRSICHSSEPQTSTVSVSSPRPKCLGHRCSELKLDGSHCLRLPSHGSPSQGDPKKSTEIPLQLPVSTTLLKQSHNYVFHSNPQHLNMHAWYLGVDSSKNKASLWRWQRELLPLRSSTRTIYKSKWALFEKWCRENSVDFSAPSVKQISDFFMYPYQDLNRRPSTIDSYRTALLKLWAQRATILHKVQTFTCYSPVFTGIVQKVPGIFVSGTFLLFSMSSQKRPLSL